MKLFMEVLREMNTLEISGAPPKSITSVTSNSNDVRRGGVFVAVRGESVDGHDFIGEAVRRGASTIVAERKPDIGLPGKVTLVITKDTRNALARMADYYYDSPSKKVKVIGVTGTNGKTTVTYLVEAMLRNAGRACARIGTTGYDTGKSQYKATVTTPDSVALQRMLNEASDAGAEYCALEVSSHALTQSRVDFVRFQVAVFTNLTQDHLDYHKSMESYYKSKARLFIDHSPKVAVVNIDDPYASKLLGAIEGDLFTYGLEGFADITAEDVVMSMSGTNLTLKTPKGSVEVRSALTGAHNIYNILAATAVGVAEGIDIDKLAEGIGSLNAVPGRFERIVEGQGFGVIVDYAHTHDAIGKVVETARKLTRGRVITIFGCGGDRDKEKRPLMGRAAWRLSDVVVVTSDNPRSESPDRIIDDILDGIIEEENPGATLKVVDDRREAIRTAISLAVADDIVLIVGKGHEDYQIIGDTRHHFDDREEARAILKERYGSV